MVYVLLDLLWLVPKWYSLPGDLAPRTNVRSMGTDAAIIVTAASAVPQITSVTPSSESMVSPSAQSCECRYE